MFGIHSFMVLFMLIFACQSHAVMPAQSFLRETGGMIDVPPQGCVLIANCQNRLPVEVFAESIERLSSVMRVNFKTASINDFDFFQTAETVKSREKAAIAVFIVDKPNLPISFVAPEENYGIINIAALETENCSNTILKERAQIAFMRTSILTLGAWVGEGGSLLKGITKSSQLDTLKGKTITLFEIRDIMNHLLSLGIKRGYSTTYRQAYMEGWAPPPTNDVQRAIIEQIQADKERGPTNPIKIPPPKKK